jgi:effector-binding domain-containing protein
MQTEVQLQHRDRAVIFSRLVEVRLSQIGTVLSTSFQEAYGYMASHRVTPTEPPFVIYHGSPGVTDLPFRVEICVPIRAPLDPPEGWRLADLPGGTFASVVHVGPYDSVGAAYDELQDWIAGHGHVIAGPPREVYLSPPSTPPAEIRTIVEFPVTPATALAATG